VQYVSKRRLYRRDQGAGAAASPKTSGLATGKNP